MAKKSTNATAVARQILKEGETLSEGTPVVDMATMNADEKDLFLEVVKASIEAIHSTHMIQNAANMEVFFASSCKSAMVFAGLHVKEYRKLKARLT